MYMYVHLEAHQGNHCNNSMYGKIVQIPLIFKYISTASNRQRVEEDTLAQRKYCSILHNIMCLYYI